MSRLDNFDVLRGMDVESTPFRLGRASRATSSDDARAGASQPELAIRQGYEDGLQQGKSEGLRCGYEEGFRKAQEEAMLQAQAAVEQAVSDAVRSVREQEQKALALCAALEIAERARLGGLEEELVALSYQMVCAVVGAHAIDPETVRAHLAHIVSELKAGQGITLHLHPQDAALMDALRPAEDPGEAAQLGPRWMADAEVTIGGCLVVREGGGLDLRLETALDRCKEVLLEARARRTPRAEKR